MDYSCYLKITNNLTQSLTLVDKSAQEGSWSKEPPRTVSGNSTSIQFQLKDSFGFYGSRGSFYYESDFFLWRNYDSRLRLVALPAMIIMSMYQ